MGVRTLLLLARLLFLDLASLDDAPAEGQAFVFLGHGDKGAAVDERQLLDAVAIYTRDLGVALLQSPGKQPQSLSPGALDDVAALLRARGARLGFWCQSAPGGRQIELVTVDPRRSVGRYAFDPDNATRSDLYRSIALRLRAILVGVEPGEAGPSGTALSPSSATPAAPVTPPPVHPAQPAEAAVTRPAPPPQEDQSPPERRVPARPPGLNGSSDEWPRMFFGVGYALSYPLGTSAGAASPRHALALDVMVATHGHLEWDFGTDLAPSSDRTSAVASISVMDIPLRLGGRWVHQQGPVTVAAGPFVGVHWLSATASAPMQTDQRTAFGGAGGVDLVARGPGFAGFAAQVRVWGEVNVPRTRFTIQGVPNYDVGTLRLGLNVEIVAPVPQ